MRSAAFRMNEKAHAFKEDMATYREKLKERRNRDAEEDWDDIDMEELDFEETEAGSDSGSLMESMRKAMDVIGEEKTTKIITKENPDGEEVSPEVEGYLKGVENVLDAVQTQMEQIDEAENFLKSAFGDVDPSEWDDEEEAEEKPEE